MAKKKYVIGIGVAAVVLVIIALGVLIYLISNTKPAKLMLIDESLAALDYLPDPGPIVPGLLKASDEEIEEARRIEEAASAKELQKVREKINSSEYYQSKRLDLNGNGSYVVIKVFDESDEQKVEIKVKSFTDKNDTVLISTKSEDKDQRKAGSNVEVLVKKNETVVIGSTLPPEAVISAEDGEVTTRKDYEIKSDIQVKSQD